MCVLSTVVTLLRLPRPGDLLSTLNRRLVAAMVLNRDMGAGVRLPWLGDLRGAPLSALRRLALLCQWQTSGTTRGCLMRSCGTSCFAWPRRRRECPWSCGNACSMSRTWCRDRSHMPPHLERSTPSYGCGWRTWLPPVPWATRTWDRWWCWRGRGIGSLCGWNRGPLIGSWCWGQAGAAAVQGVYLLRGPRGPVAVHGSRGPCAEVLAREHPGSTSRGCGGDEETTHPGAGCMARGP